MKPKYFAMTLIIAVALTSAFGPQGVSFEDTEAAKRPATETPPTDRTYLPVPSPDLPTFTELDVRDAKALFH